MTRLATVPSVESAQAASRVLLLDAQKRIGALPNIIRTMAISPATLEGYLAFSRPSAKGALPSSIARRIALAMSEMNSCAYGLVAHSYLARKIDQFDDDEIAANRDGGSLDARADAAVRFAVAVARARGRVSDEALTDVRSAKFSDAEIIEIVKHVALNNFTSLLNSVAQTEIDADW